MTQGRFLNNPVVQGAFSGTTFQLFGIFGDFGTKIETKTITNPISV